MAPIFESYHGAKQSGVRRKWASGTVVGIAALLGVMGTALYVADRRAGVALVPGAPAGLDEVKALAAANGGCDLGKTSSHGQPCGTASEPHALAPSELEVDARPVGVAALAVDNGGCDLGKTSSHGQPCSTTTESEEAEPAEAADALAADNGGCDLGKTSSHGQPCSTTTTESEEAEPTEAADAFEVDNGGCDLGKTSSHGQPCKNVLADAVNRQSVVPSAEAVDETESGTGSVAAKADELRNKQTKRDTSAASAVVDWGTDASDSTSSGTDPYPDPVTTDSIWVTDDGGDGDGDGAMKNRETSNVPGSIEKGTASGITWATFGYPSPTMNPTPAPVVVVTMRQRISAWIKMGVQGRYNVVFFSVLGGILIGGTLVACFLSRRRRLERERLADELEKSALEARLVP